MNYMIKKQTTFRLQSEGHTCIRSKLKQVCKSEMPKLLYYFSLLPIKFFLDDRKFVGTHKRKTMLHQTQSVKSYYIKNKTVNS